MFSLVHFLVLLLLLLTRLYRSKAAQEQCISGEDDKTCASTEARSGVHQDCSLVMAPSALDGWGIFTLYDRRRGAPILPGDIVIQVPDILNTAGVQFFKENYWKPAHETGGMSEGRDVFSVTPGIGMLTNSLHGKSNILPYQVDRDDGDCARESCTGAGSFTQYHNYTWYFHKDVQAGHELLSPQTDDWFKEQGLWSDNESESQVESPRHSLDWLRQHGVCLDNMRPKSSSIAGRGAFATRFLPQDSIVAPVPVIPIFDWKISLNLIKIQKSKHTESLRQEWQLLLNYCYGHPNSSLLLFPYSPVVNLINSNSHAPNVKLQWSPQHNRMDWLKWDLSDLEDHAYEPGLVMEVVALRDIKPGEEILLNYGAHWVAAWKEHQDAVSTRLADASMHKKADAPLYTPAHVMDQVATKIRTHSEQSEYPYPANLQTGCFYEYPYKNSTINSDTPASASSPGFTALPWNWTRTVFNWINLRPCTVLKRDDSASFYTVQIMRNKSRQNEGIDPLKGGSERKKSYLVVSKVPRMAIRFMDKIYTTDQHLSHAFRHWIGIPDDIYPQAWRDENVESYGRSE